MRIFASLFAAGALLGATQASATDDPTAAAPTTPPPPSAMPAPASHTDSNQVICKREQSTESRLGGAKICHTRQEWADIAAAARTSVEGAQRSSFTGLVPGH
jgi:hypothetical protein